MQTKRTVLGQLYFFAGIAFTLATAAVFIALSSVLLANGIGGSQFNIGVVLVIAILILSPVEAEVHERLHVWGFERAGVPTDQITIMRPTLRSALGLGAKDEPKWWRTAIARPITRDAYRIGLLASLWIVPLGAFVGAVALGLVGQAVWQSTVPLGALFFGMIVLLGTLRDMYVYISILDTSPTQLFKVR